jgi:hypothetical protein
VNSAGSAIAFVDASSAIDASPSINQVFWAGMPDVNGDGCLDIYVGAHDDGTDSNMLIHDNVGGVCQNTFTYFADVDNYSQASPVTPRITSRYIWGNWYGHPEGMWSFYGADVDGSASAKYVLDPAFTTVGGQPEYLAKGTSCFGERPKCIIADVDGGGDFEVVSKLYAAPYNTGYVVDLDTGATLYTPSSNSGTFTDGLMVLDLDNDGYVEFVQIEEQGFYNWNGTGVDWVGNAFDTVPGEGEDRHALVLDYDVDGDLDVVQIQVPYNTSCADCNVPRLWRNNGDNTFTDVSATAFASMPTLSGVTGASSYANSQIADFDNNGYPDIAFAMENYNNAITIIQNNGDGTFTKTTELGADTTPLPWGQNSNRPWIGAADYNNDGRVDLITNGDNDAGSVVQGVLLQNTTNNSNNWMRVRVRGEGANTDGLHTRLSFFEAGTTNLITYYHTGVFSQGYQNLITHAGLSNNATVDVRAEFPHGGPVCNFSNVAADADYIVYRSCDIEVYTPGSTIPLTYQAQTSSVNTQVTLVADSTITATSSELVTFALPFAEGEVTSLDEINVSIGANEQAAYVEQGLTWWSDNSIRSATIQLQNVDMSGGDVTLTVTDAGFNVARLTEQPHSNGWATAGADKNNLQFPRIFALHDKQYLADSGLIPPYDPAPDIQDDFETYQVAQFNNWAGGLNYSTSSSGNWLFDRSSSMFKAYMTTGRVEFLKEAFLSKQFYFNYVRNVGDPVAAAGGDGCFEFDTVACADGKYIAPQQAKLALGLVGDNSQWDDSLINEMALQADLGWNQYGTRDAFDNENEGFTERGAGMAGLAELTAWEITGDATVLSNMNERIASLKDMQQTVKAWDTTNGWTPKSGGFTHNIDVHEGVHTEQSAIVGDTDARGFSAWMSENIADFLWQAYHVTGNADAPEMLRQLANAVETYGFTTSYNTVTDSYALRSAFSGQNHTQSCNTTGANTDHLYMASAYASDVQLAGDDWWPYYSDNHNIETVLTLSAGYRFETDADNKEKLLSRINEIQAGWINTNCALVFSNVYRLFNWQHRSNSIRTAERIIREDV